MLAYLGNGDGTFTLKGTTPTPNSGLSRPNGYGADSGG
jgi:hypothetical protein